VIRNTKCIDSIGRFEGSLADYKYLNREGLWPQSPYFLPSKYFSIHPKIIQSPCRWKQYGPSETPDQSKYQFAVVNPKTTVEAGGGEYRLCAHCKRNCRSEAQTVRNNERLCPILLRHNNLRKVWITQR